MIAMKSAQLMHVLIYLPFALSASSSKSSKRCKTVSIMFHVTRLRIKFILNIFLRDFFIFLSYYDNY